MKILQVILLKLFRIMACCDGKNQLILGVNPTQSGRMSAILHVSYNGLHKNELHPAHLRWLLAVVKVYDLWIVSSWLWHCTSVHHKRYKLLLGSKMQVAFYYVFLWASLSELRAWLFDWLIYCNACRCIVHLWAWNYSCSYVKYQVRVRTLHTGQFLSVL